MQNSKGSVDSGCVPGDAAQASDTQSLRGDDNNKMSSNTEVVVAAPAVAAESNHIADEAQYADDGDGEFIPVVKEKRKNKTNEKAAAAEKPSGAGGKSSGKSGHGSSRRRGRRSAAAAAAASAAGGSVGESAGHQEAGGASDNGTADEHSNDDTPKKFVEAPIPAVNVWKVRMSGELHNMRVNDFWWFIIHVIGRCVVGNRRRLRMRRVKFNMHEDKSLSPKYSPGGDNSIHRWAAAVSCCHPPPRDRATSPAMVVCSI